MLTKGVEPLSSIGVLTESSVPDGGFIQLNYASKVAGEHKPHALTVHVVTRVGSPKLFIPSSSKVRFHWFLVPLYAPSMPRQPKPPETQEEYDARQW